MRLRVFPQYLEYRIARKANQLQQQRNFWTFYKQQGVVYYNNNPEYIMSFDEWLVHNYSNLII